MIIIEDKMQNTRGNMIYEDCGTIATTKTQNSGSLGMELFLYTVAVMVAVPTFFVSLLVPFVYSIHRRIVSVEVCRNCGDDEVVNIFTPRGEELVKEMAFEEVK